jgi:hypothetical protein
MSHKLALIAFTVLALGASAADQNTLTGTWRGVTNAGASVQLDLTAKGTTLTGTLTRNRESTPISDGKVSKDGFTFRATLNGQSEGYSGERAGDELKVWLDRQGRETAIVLTRAKRTAPNR